MTIVDEDDVRGGREVNRPVKALCCGVPTQKRLGGRTVRHEQERQRGGVAN